MIRSSIVVLATAALASPSLAAPAPTKRSPPSKVPVAAADATLIAEPVVTRSADGMMTPMPVKLRTTTPVEAEANAVWNLRAALNIAALQCQFSPFLATVRTYNDVLRQHSEELDRARITMTAHFRRYDGKQAQNSFDRYTTQTYNSFSTLDAQLAFCDRAALAGREVLTVRKGNLGKSAARIRDEVRIALIPVGALSLLTPFEITPELLPPF